MHAKYQDVLDQIKQGKIDDDILDKLHEAADDASNKYIK